MVRKCFGPFCCAITHSICSALASVSNMYGRSAQGNPIIGGEAILWLSTSRLCFWSFFSVYIASDTVFLRILFNASKLLFPA